MENKIVAIHQPNLFPWLGYFNKIVKCDAFVFLDHVLMNPRTSINPKKVNIILNKNEYALTVPLKNKKGETFQKIQDMEIEKPDLIAQKHLRTIEQNYKKAPYFDETYPLIQSFYNASSPFIAERNIQFVSNVMKGLGLTREFYRSSELGCEESATALLVEIILKVQGGSYLSGDGASGYQDQQFYKRNNIALTFTNYQHPEYPQFNTEHFKKGLSIIDALMNCGFKETKRLLLKNQVSTS